MKDRRILFYAIGTRWMPSSRVRVYTIAKYLEERDRTVKIIPAFSDFFCRIRIDGKKNHLINILCVLNALPRLILFLLLVPYYRTIVIQKIQFPPVLLPFLLLLLKKRKVLFDLDDPIYRPHPAEKAKTSHDEERITVFRKNARLYDIIVVSTSALKEDMIRTFGFRNDFVAVCHDAVDTDYYKSFRHHTEMPVIGWVGTPPNSIYLKNVLPEIARLHEQGFCFSLYFCGADNELLSEVFPFQEDLHIESDKWSLERDRDIYDRLDIGLMPLHDDEWSRTKAGYKLMLYMSMEKIAVASDVGINRDIVDNGKNGFLVSKSDDWIPTLKTILTNYSGLERLRVEARRKIVSGNSVEHIGRRMVQIIGSI